MSNDEKQGNYATNAVKHDIKNQLSNITLALEQLKHEMPVGNEDSEYYLEIILASCKSINALVNNL